jgi:carbon storage regulator
MLCLTRKAGGSIIFAVNGKQVTLTILAINGAQVRVGIEAPPEVKIWRNEILEALNKQTIGVRHEARST